MKRTDDFLADLEAQLGAASAGRLRPRRRLRVAHVLRPALVAATAATAIFAIVLAAGTGGGDPERAADPLPPASGGPFVLAEAPRGECSADPGRAEVPGLSVLRRQGGTARADAPVRVVGMADVASCVAEGPTGPGACVVVDLDGRRSACWAIGEIEAGRAAATLGEGFLVALLPDRFKEVTFVIGDERDTYRVTDNVVIANLEAARPGARVELHAGTQPPPGCGDGRVEDGPLPEELLVALPILREAEASPVPDALADRLATGGAERVWLHEARRHEGDGASEAWVVPVADSRFAECGDPLIDAPRAFEGPGACLAILHEGELKSALCADLDDLAGATTAAVPGGRVAAAFLPHGTHSVDFAGTVLRDMEPPWGIVFGPVPDRDALPVRYIGDDGPIDPGDLRSRTVTVLASEEEAAAAAEQRLREAGVAGIGSLAAPRSERSRVMFATGMARAAHQVAEVMRIQDVVPLDLRTQELADPADVVVVLGDDMRP